MASGSSSRRKGNAFFFFAGIVFVALCVLGGIFYLIPGFYHPFSSDTAGHTFAHATIAAGFFVAAVLGLIVVRVNRPPPGDEITIP
jgi:hypothetical protein